MDITLLAVDLAKKSFQLHGVASNGEPVLRKALSRLQFIRFIETLSPCIVAMESCGSSQYWGRVLQRKGHEVRIIPSQFVKPFRKDQKNDANDAIAIAEAAIRPSMRFVSVKSTEQQYIQSVHRVRQRLVHNQTALTNQIRGILEERGIIMAKGHAALVAKLKDVLSSDQYELDVQSKQLIQDLLTEYLDLSTKIEDFDGQLEQIGSQNEQIQYLQTIPGVGVKISTAFVAAIGDAAHFKNGRNASAWLGLVPGQNSTGGRQVLMGITKHGDKYLRSLVVHGARSLVYAVQRKTEEPKDALGRWIWKKLKVKHINEVTVAVANKNVRIMWALLSRNQKFCGHLAAAA